LFCVFITMAVFLYDSGCYFFFGVHSLVNCFVIRHYFNSVFISRFDELAREERFLSQEVDALDRRFDVWLLPGNAAAAVIDGAKTQRVAPSSRDITADLPPEVAAFEVYVQLYRLS